MEDFRPGMRVVVPSGFGGSFYVRLIERDSHDPEVWKVKIDMPENPDWHGAPWAAPKWRKEQ